MAKKKNPYDVEAGARRRDTNKPKPAPRAGDLRIATYNVRVDHPEDINTVHDWGPMRRGLVASQILALDADLVALQEPSPSQAKDLEADLGSEWAVDVLACDPDAWDASAKEGGPSEGDAREGNGIAYRKGRFKLLHGACFWLSPTPDEPSEAPSEWGGSAYQRTCYRAMLRDLWSGQNIVVYSAHFDNDADDSYDSGGSFARSESAKLVMQKARDDRKTRGVSTVLVCGDFNTFEDRNGATHAALIEASNDQFDDIRDVKDIRVTDSGRDDSSWEGWETDPYSRQQYGNQRYSHIFVPKGTKAARTTVAEERFLVSWGEQQWVYASDHCPIVADLLLDAKRKGGRHGIAPIAVNSPAALGLIAALAVMLLAALGVMGWMVYEMAGGRNIECRFECRDIAYPWENGAVSSALNCSELGCNSC